MINAKESAAKHSHEDGYPYPIAMEVNNNGGTKSPNREMLLTQLTANVSYSGPNLFVSLAAAKPNVNPAPDANPTRMHEAMAE